MCETSNSLYGGVKTTTFPRTVEVVEDWIKFYNCYRVDEQHITVFVSRDSMNLVYYHTHIPGIILDSETVKLVIKRLEESDKLCVPEKENITENRKTKLSFISKS